MPFQIIRNDITKVKADAIVNTANPKPIIGSGTDQAIYKVAGEKFLLEERKKIGCIEPGHVVFSNAFNLNAKYILHTVGPAWIDGTKGEREILRSCYAKSLEMAAKLGCASIAFPLIATGVYGFPKDEALQIALSEINSFLLAHDMKVILVVFDKRAFELSGRLVENIEEYIDEHIAQTIREEEYYRGYEYEQRIRNYRESASNKALQEDWSEDEEYEEEQRECDDTFGAVRSSVILESSGKSLDEMLEKTSDTFQQRLFHLIDESGMDDVTVYKKANIDRKVFSRIRCKQDYKPKKKTAVAFAIALQLDMETMIDLLARAEIAFSPSNKFDLIITYFVTHQIYDVYEINAALFKYGQPILGD